MSRKGMLQRLAVVGIGAAGAVLAVSANAPGIASAKPDICSQVECMPDVPPDRPNHPGPIPYPPYQPQQDYRQCNMTYSQQCVDWEIP
jgi:hypothetical protein